MIRRLCLTGCIALAGACSGDGEAATITTTGGATGGATAATGVTAATGSFSAQSTSGPSPTLPPQAGDGGSCESYTLGTDRAAPDMMIVMDASGSMAGASFGGGVGVARWGPAVNAVNEVVSELDRVIQFGLMTFPNDAIGCAPGDVDVPMGPMNAQPIANVLANTRPALGNTPTSTTLTAAGMALAAREPTLAGEFPLPKYIMLVTDGDPNCVDVQDPITSLLGGATGVVDTGAQKASFDEVTRLAQAGVLTYVIGYDTAATPFSSLLDQMAVAGGTGDTAHRSVSSGAELLEEFRKITSGAVSCSFVVAQDVDFSRVKITVDGVEANYGEDWTIRDDNRTIELLSSTCQALQVGGVVDAEVTCGIVNLI